MAQGISIKTSDDLNHQVIALLQEDGRLPYTTIARQLGTSEGTIRSRVKSMEEQGMLRVIGVADPFAFGYTAYAMLGIKVASGFAPGEVATHFRDAESVTYILETGGRFDMLVEVICKSHEDLREFIANHVYKDSCVRDVEVMIGLAMHKNLLKWGMS